MGRWVPEATHRLYHLQLVESLKAGIWNLQIGSREAMTSMQRNLALLSWIQAGTLVRKNSGLS